MPSTIPPPTPTPTPPPTPYVDVIYKFSDFTPLTFTEPYQLDLIASIASALSLSYSEVVITGITSGSAVVTVQITAQTIQQANQFAEQINSITLSPTLGTYIIEGINVVNPTISNICFPAGTPIETDQGIVPINELDRTIHTIGNKSILHVTNTVTLDKYLISFSADAIAFNYPNKTTIMTKDHKIKYNGKLISAHRFLGNSKLVNKVKYSGEVLYNVLLEDYSTMKVNNLVCETLHPDNIIAKLYTSNFSETYKQNVISIMNDTLYRKDGQAYKSIVNRLH
jgi:hypothetical protein